MDTRAGDRSRWRSRIILGLIVAVVYAASRKLSIELSAGIGAPVWLASGVAWAALMLCGKQYWPSILIAGWLVNLAQYPWPAAAGFAVGNVLEALAGVWIMSSIERLRKQLGYFEILAGAALVALLTPILGASAGTLTRWLAEGLPPSKWLVSWSGRWLHDVLGLLMLAPAVIPLLESARAGWKDWNGKRLAFIGPILFGCLSVSWIAIFHKPFHPALFSLFPCIILAAAWLDEAGPGLAALVIAAMAIWAIQAGQWPFAVSDGTIPSAMFFMACVFLHALALSYLRRVQTLLLPGIVLLAGWFFGGWMYRSFDGNRAALENVHFDTLVQVAEHNVQQQMSSYEEALLGASEFLSAATHVDQNVWHAYVDRLHVMDRYPGNSTMVLLQPIASSDLERFAAEQRSKGSTGFTIHQSLNSDGSPVAEHFVVAALEPMTLYPGALG